MQVRSKAKWIDEDERISKYICNLENKIILVTI